MIWVLLCKDIVQHARALSALAASAPVLPLLFALLAGSQNGSAGYTGFVFGYLGVSMPMILAQWFIGQEKVKGTFRVLRLLPVSGTHIIIAKVLGALLLCISLINLTLVLEPPVCRIVGLEIAQPPAQTVLWTNLIALFSLGISITLFTMLDTRIAVQAVIWAFCGIMLLGYGIQRFLGKKAIADFSARAEEYSHVPGVLWLAAMPIILAFIAMVCVSAWSFERREWSDLEEN